MIGRDRSRGVARAAYGFAKRGAPLGARNLCARRASRGDRSASLREISRTPSWFGRARPITPKGMASRSVRRTTPQAGPSSSASARRARPDYLAMALAVRSLMDKEIKRIIWPVPPSRPVRSSASCPLDGGEGQPLPRPLSTTRCRHDGHRARRAAHRQGDHRGRAAGLMRGRTLNDSFVTSTRRRNTNQRADEDVLDQNSLQPKAVITGDVTQIDLTTESARPREAREVLSGIDLSALLLPEIDSRAPPHGTTDHQGLEGKGGHHRASPKAIRRGALVSGARAVVTSPGLPSSAAATVWWSSARAARGRHWPCSSTCAKSSPRGGRSSEVASRQRRGRPSRRSPSSSPAGNDSRCRSTSGRRAFGRVVPRCSTHERDITSSPPRGGVRWVSPDGPPLRLGG